MLNTVLVLCPEIKEEGQMCHECPLITHGEMNMAPALSRRNYDVVAVRIRNLSAVDHGMVKSVVLSHTMTGIQSIAWLKARCPASIELV